MDLEDAGCRTKCLIRDRDGKYPALFDAILADSGITVVRSGVRMPRMNSIMERWIQACRLQPLPEPITDPATLTHLNVRRRDRLGGSSTNTRTPPDQRGRDFRHPQGPSGGLLSHVTRQERQRTRR